MLAKCTFVAASKRIRTNATAKTALANMRSHTAEVLLLISLDHSNAHANKQCIQKALQSVNFKP